MNFIRIIIWTLLLLVLGLYASVAQTIDSTYTAQYLTRSTKFAWTTYGADLMVLPGGQAQYLPNNPLSTANFGAAFQPRFTIGGIHFWGHADFYVTFPLPLTLNQKPEVFKKLKYHEGIESGVRLYPWALKPQRLRPYTGISFKTINYGHQTEGTDYPKGFATYQRFVSPIQMGLTYVTSKYLISGGVHYLFNRRAEYAITPQATGAVRFNPLAFNISLLRYIDSDRSLRTARGIEQENVKHYLLKREHKLSGFYWAVGPSAALQRSKSPYFERKKPFFYNDLTGGFMPDVAFGYHFAKPDLNVGASYRTMGSRLAAFDTEVRLRRHAVTLETYKFLFNYLGFVPYVGLTASLENLSVKVNEQRTAATKPALGLIFGWDIRVTRTGNSLLRTNLRYVPGLHLKVEGEKVMFDHLEFNFIQYVRFIGRKNFYARYTKKGR
jgi:hypothetical protein